MIEWVNHPPDESLPAYVEIHKPDYSFQVFQLLEAFSDGYGAWQVTIDWVLSQPDWLKDDLVAIASLAGKIRAQNRSKDKGKIF